jgi:hypothetical protein
MANGGETGRCKVEKGVVVIEAVQVKACSFVGLRSSCYKMHKEALQTAKMIPYPEAFFSEQNRVKTSAKNKR